MSVRTRHQKKKEQKQIDAKETKVEEKNVEKTTKFCKDCKFYDNSGLDTHAWCSKHVGYVGRKNNCAEWEPR